MVTSARGAAASVRAGHARGHSLWEFVARRPPPLAGERQRGRWPRHARIDAGIDIRFRQRPCVGSVSTPQPCFCPVVRLWAVEARGHHVKTGRLEGRGAAGTSSATALWMECLAYRTIAPRGLIQMNFYALARLRAHSATSRPPAGPFSWPAAAKRDRPERGLMAAIEGSRHGHTLFTHGAWICATRTAARRACALPVQKPLPTPQARSKKSSRKDQD